MYEFSIYNPSFFGETVCFVLPTAILRISSGKKTTAGSLAQYNNNIRIFHKQFLINTPLTKKIYQGLAFLRIQFHFDKKGPSNHFAFFNFQKVSASFFADFSQMNQHIILTNCEITAIVPLIEKLYSFFDNQLKMMLKSCTISNNKTKKVQYKTARY